MPAIAEPGAIELGLAVSEPDGGAIGGTVDVPDRVERTRGLAELIRRVSLRADLTAAHDDRTRPRRSTLRR